MEKLMETIITSVLAFFDILANFVTWGHWGWSQGNKSSRAHVKGVHTIRSRK